VSSPDLGRRHRQRGCHGPWPARRRRVTLNGQACRSRPRRRGQQREARRPKRAPLRTMSTSSSEPGSRSAPSRRGQSNEDSPRRRQVRGPSSPMNREPRSPAEERLTRKRGLVERTRAERPPHRPRRRGTRRGAHREATSGHRALGRRACVPCSAPHPPVRRAPSPAPLCPVCRPRPHPRCRLPPSGA
jgi:hypothetical protein